MNETFSTIETDESRPFRFALRRISFVHTHWHPAIEIVIVLSGSASVYTADGLRTLERDDVLLINAGCRHEIRSEAGCDAISFRLEPGQLALSANETDSLYFRCDSAAEPSREKYANLKSLIAIAIRRNLTGGQVSMRENRSIAYSIYKELTQKFAAAPPPGLEDQRRALERMTPIAAYVEAHYREGLTLKALAEAVHLTPTYLSAIFTKYLGVTFSEYYNGVRLSHAVQDLAATEDTLEQIAAANGYASTQAFARAFRAAYSKLPSAYRRQYISERPGAPGDVDLSLARRYLPQSAAGLCAEDEPQRTAVNAQWNNIIGSFDGTFRRLLGIGSAKQILIREVQVQLEEIQRRIGFEYIRFHGLFSDEMMTVSRDNDGRLRFNFKLTDKVFDYLFSIGLKPVLVFSFMPRELSQDKEKLIYNNRFNTSQPERVEDWCSMIQSFMEHILGRYGRAAVADLPVMIWNNADTMPEMFGMQDEDVFFRLYCETYRTVKAIVPEIRVGAPPLTFMNGECISWAERFFKRLRADGLIPDFFCCQYYGEVGANPGELKIDLGTARPDHLYRGSEDREDFSLSAGVPLAADPDRLRRHIAFVKEFQASLGLEALPLWITEFNISFSHRQLLHDTLFAGCYVLKNVLENISSVEALGYWSATDYIEEQQLEDQIFHGGLGLMTIDGIRKPQFIAYETLRQLQPHILARGEGYLISRSDRVITVVTYNYEHYSEIYAQNKTYNMTQNERYTPFSRQRRREYRFHLEGLGKRQVAEATEFIITRTHGSAFDKWVEMGSPAQGIYLPLDQYRLELLKASAYPLCRTVPLKTANGKLDYGCTLEPLEFRLTQILLK